MHYHTHIRTIEVHTLRLFTRCEELYTYHPAQQLIFDKNEKFSPIRWNYIPMIYEVGRVLYDIESSAITFWLLFFYCSE